MMCDTYVLMPFFLSFFSLQVSNSIVLPAAWHSDGRIQIDSRLCNLALDIRGSAWWELFPKDRTKWLVSLESKAFSVFGACRTRELVVPVSLNNPK